MLILPVIFWFLLIESSFFCFFIFVHYLDQISSSNNEAVSGHKGNADESLNDELINFYEKHQILIQILSMKSTTLRVHIQHNFSVGGTFLFLFFICIWPCQCLSDGIIFVVAYI